MKRRNFFSTFFGILGFSTCGALKGDAQNTMQVQSKFGLNYTAIVKYIDVDLNTETGILTVTCERSDMDEGKVRFQDIYESVDGKIVKTDTIKAKYIAPVPEKWEYVK